MLGLSRVNSRFRLSVDFAFKMTGKAQGGGSKAFIWFLVNL